MNKYTGVVLKHAWFVRTDIIIGATISFVWNSSGCALVIPLKECHTHVLNQAVQIRHTLKTLVRIFESRQTLILDETIGLSTGFMILIDVQNHT